MYIVKGYGKTINGNYVWKEGVHVMPCLSPDTEEDLKESQHGQKPGSVSNVEFPKYKFWSIAMGMKI
jgi:hypothetical protein